MSAEEKQALIAQRLGGALKGATFSQKIPRRSGTGPATLSFAQQRLWFMDRLKPGMATYNIPKVFRLKGPMDIALLERILNEIVRRHDALRTTFTVMNQEPVQRVVPSLTVTLPVVDLTAIPAGRREEEALRRAGDEGRKPFDLEKGPLFTPVLLRLAPEDHMLVLSMHHIISDGWSVGVMFREISGLYKAFHEGAASPLPELPIQYADFAEWQRQVLTDEAMEKQKAYWMKKLSGELPVLDLPADRPRPTVQSFRGSSCTFRIPKEHADSLKAIGRKEGATLFMMLVAAFNVLLHRYTGSKDIIFGTPFAGRSRVELEPLIGFFVNTMVIRTDLSGDPTFLELLKRVRASALEAFSHQDFPFEKIVEAIHPDRDPGRSPVFQLMFAVQTDTDRDLQMPGMEVAIQEVYTDTAKFDMTISMTDTPGGITMYWEYSTDLFDRKRIERMAAHFQKLLAEIAANPARRLWQFPLLSPEERELLVTTWNQTGAAPPPERSVQELFEEQAAATPEATALEFRGDRLSYRQLNARANKVAHKLMGLGVKRGSIVGVCMERSPEMIVGLLGIVKAGGAYLPLDHDLPAERLEMMSTDCGIDTLLVQEHLAGHVPGFKGREIVIGPSDEPGPDVNPGAQSGPDDLFYIMYTSGSTGRPKGIDIVHRGVVRLAKGVDYARIVPGEVMMLFAPLSFDASTFEIWCCLLNGGKLVVFPSVKASMAEIGQVVATSGITTVWLTEALFEQVVSEILEDLKDVPQVLTGGDVLSMEHARKFLQRYPDKLLVNAYGPTENTTFTTCCPLRGREEFASSIPIGRPIANTQVYVLDEQMEVVPVGVAGELYIGGVGLGQGYHGRPDLTAERFVPDPFGRGGGRLYRSGDMVRYREDGRIEFLGRRDHQVKLRGYRIELGEIEAVLRSQEGVKEAVVVVREDRVGDKRLVGYCVGEKGKVLEGGELRAKLRKKLPEYMVPSRIEMLERMPLNPNGKVDRRALPAPKQEERAEGKQKARTPAEEVVAKIWAEVLGLEEIGVEENFFELGGHSLLATRVLSRLQEATGVEIPLVSFFETPTVAALALLFEAKLLDDVERMRDDGSH